jgi:hypothetical protein
MYLAFKLNLGRVGASTGLPNINAPDGVSILAQTEPRNAAFSETWLDGLKRFAGI